MGVQISPSARALVAQRIERSPAEAEAVGSNPAKRAILRAVSSAVRAPALHAGSRRFKSPTAHFASGGGEVGPEALELLVSVVDRGLREGLSARGPDSQ